MMPIQKQPQLLLCGHIIPVFVRPVLADGHHCIRRPRPVLPAETAFSGSIAKWIPAIRSPEFAMHNNGGHDKIVEHRLGRLGWIQSAYAIVSVSTITYAPWLEIGITKTGQRCYVGVSILELQFSNGQDRLSKSYSKRLAARNSCSSKYGFFFGASPSHVDSLELELQKFV